MGHATSSRPWLFARNGSHGEAMSRIREQIISALAAGALATGIALAVTALPAGAVSPTWHVGAVSAWSACDAQAGVAVGWSFPNAEASRAMQVTAKVTGAADSTQVVAAGDTWAGQTTAGGSDMTLPAGTVHFDLAWTDGDTSTDHRSASYDAAGPCAESTTTSSTTSSTTTTSTTDPTSTTTGATTTTGGGSGGGDLGSTTTAGSGGADTLPFTGSGTRPILVLSLILIAAGMAALLANRRRAVLRSTE